MAPTPTPASALLDVSKGIHQGERPGTEGAYLPTRSSGTASAQTWQMAPMQKTPTDRRRVMRRPRESPAGAARRAPTTVPALRMATMMDRSLGQISGSAGEPQLVANCFLNAIMARIPLMALVRVSVCLVMLVRQHAVPTCPSRTVSPSSRSNSQTRPDHIPPSTLQKGTRANLPSVVSEEQTTGCHKETDHDGRRRRACDIVGLMPAHGNRHGARWDVSPR